MALEVSSIAFVLRIASYGLAIAGMGSLLLRKESGVWEHALVLGGAACLMASGAIVSSDFVQIMASLLVFAFAVALDVLFAKTAPSASCFLLPALYLCCLGVSIVFDMEFELLFPQRQAVFAVMGMVLCGALLVLLRNRTDVLRGSLPILLGVVVVLCALPLFSSIGIAANGARAWIRFGSVVLRPSEFVKVMLVLSVSVYLTINAEHMREFNVTGLIPICVVFAVALVLALTQSNLGTGLILFALFVPMCVQCGRKAGLMYAAVIVACMLILLGIGVAVYPYVGTRFVAWLDPNSDPLGVGYQRLTSIDAMANGGLLGTGLHQGVYFSSIPAVSNDYVFAAIIEELGILGGATVLLSIGTLVAMVLRSASDLPEASFERNVLLCGVSLLLFQALVIIAGVLGIIPHTGVILPFVGYSLSSMLSCFGLVGIMGACTSATDR